MRQVERCSREYRHMIRRLGRRAGIRRFGTGSTNMSVYALKCFVRDLIRDSNVYATYAHRNTITSDDVMRVMKKRGLIMKIKSF